MGEDKREFCYLDCSSQQAHHFCGIFVISSLPISLFRVSSKAIVSRHSELSLKEFGKQVAKV